MCLKTVIQNKCRSVQSSSMTSSMTLLPRSKLRPTQASSKVSMTTFPRNRATPSKESIIRWWPNKTGSRDIRSTSGSRINETFDKQPPSDPPAAVCSALSPKRQCVWSVVSSRLAARTHVLSPAARCHGHDQRQRRLTGTTVMQSVDDFVCGVSAHALLVRVRPCVSGRNNSFTDG
jgi:hypothetical protein